MDKHMDEARKMNALHAGLFKNENKNSSRWARVRTGLMVAIAVMLVMSAAMGAAWAYFTTYARAKGSVTLNLGHQEHLRCGLSTRHRCPPDFFLDQVFYYSTTSLHPESNCQCFYTRAHTLHKMPVHVYKRDGNLLRWSN